MPLVAGHELNVDTGSPQVYNAYDSLLTSEILGELKTLLPGDNAPPELKGPALIYDFERALQAPALEMMLRGWRVDPWARDTGITELRRRLTRLSYIIDAYAGSIWNLRSPTKPSNDYPRPVLLNPDSTQQLQKFFYECLKLPPIIKHKDNKETKSMDRDILEKLECYFLARPIISAILAYRDTCSQLEVLESEVDEDWRMRTSYNPAATKTGRWSSSESMTGSGRNLQNIEESLRYMFISDAGYKLAGADYEQSESRDIGWLCFILFGATKYLDACESGDLHTTVCRYIWKNLDWTGDPKHDRAIADKNFHRHHSYRDISKRAGHACLTEDHEVLTPKGWVSITFKPDIIMQFDGRRSKFEKVSNWIDEIQDANLITWEGQSISACMTDNHKVYYTTDENGLKKGTADYVSDKTSARIPSGWGYVGGDAPITPEDARLIAAYQCDGYWAGEGISLQIRFHMKKKRKFDRLEYLATMSGRRYYRYQDVAAVSVEEINSWPKKAGAYLLNWPPESACAYLDELPFWDGHFAKTSVSLSSIDREHLDWIRTINRLYGKGGNIQKPQKSGFGSICYSLQYNNRQYANMCSIDVTKESRTTRVLCPTVPSGFFYIRRKEKISITGNSNYLGQAPEIARQVHAPLALVRDFQNSYFGEFPEIRMLHTWAASQLQRHHYLINAFGRRRDFFGRADSSETIKQAVADLGQSTTANRTNLGLWRIWKHMGPNSSTPVELLAQLHDAIYLQRREADTDEATIVSEMQRHMNVTLSYKNRIFSVPTEPKTGWLWSNAHEYTVSGDKILKHPDGLIKFSGADLRSRTKSSSIIERGGIL